MGVGINARFGCWNKVGINEEEPGGLCIRDRSLFFIWRATGSHRKLEEGSRSTGFPLMQGSTQHSTWAGGGPFSSTGGPVQAPQAQQTTAFLPFPSLRQAWVLLCPLTEAEDQGRGRPTKHTNGSSPLWGRGTSQKGIPRL